MAFKKIVLLRSGQGFLQRFYGGRSLEAEEPLPQQTPQTTALPNGLIVSSVETDYPAARIAVAIKAGSRYEQYQNLGITHALRSNFGLSTRAFTEFGLTRNLDLLGTIRTAGVSKEYITYKLECEKPKLRDAMRFFNSMVCDQIFKANEIKQNEERMRIDVASFKRQPNLVLIENLHKAVFRDGLGNFITCPQFMLGQHTSRMLQDFVTSTFATNRMAFAAVGLNHQEAVDLSNLINYTGNATVQEVPTGPSTGGERRYDMNIPDAFAAIGYRCPGSLDQKGYFVVNVIQEILGDYPHVKRGVTPISLIKACDRVAVDPNAAKGIHFSYSDAGFLGVAAYCRGDDMGMLLRSVVDEMKLLRTDISEAHVTMAKERVKLSVQYAVEFGADLLDLMTSQSLMFGRTLGRNDLYAIIDSITHADMAQTVLGGRPSMSAVGNLIRTPHVDETS